MRRKSVILGRNEEISEEKEGERREMRKRKRRRSKGEYCFKNVYYFSRNPLTKIDPHA